MKKLHAFRAGSYGANQNTLRAVAKNGLLFDSSYNPCYLGEDCKIDLNEQLLQPYKIENAWEFPISFSGLSKSLAACAAGSMFRERNGNGFTECLATRLVLICDCFA